jgi:hypothetical protein
VSGHIHATDRHFMNCVSQFWSGREEGNERCEEGRKQKLFASVELLLFRVCIVSGDGLCALY